MELVSIARETRLARSPTLLAVVASPGFRGIIGSGDADRIRHELELHDAIDLLADLLPLASCYAEAPISGDKVAAVAQGLSGNLYFGFNTEYVHLPLWSCVHAEQAAVVNAWHDGETQIRALAVSAPPCGHCRQFLSETCDGSTMTVMFRGCPRTKLADLLPHAYHPETVPRRPCLLASSEVALLSVVSPGEDAVVVAALAAAQRSHAPYSMGYAGVALETHSGVVAGRYAENVAFNPSLSAMAAALMLLRLRDVGPAEIRRAALVSVPSPIDHSTNDTALLGAVSTTPLESFTASSSR